MLLLIYTKHNLTIESVLQAIRVLVYFHAQDTKNSNKVNVSYSRLSKSLNSLGVIGLCI